MRDGVNGHGNYPKMWRFLREHVLRVGYSGRSFIQEMYGNMLFTDIRRLSTQDQMITPYANLTFSHS